MRPFFSFMHQKCKLHERLIILISKLFIDTKTLFLCNQDIEANISATSTTKHKSTVFFILLVDNKIVFLLYQQMFQTKEKARIKSVRLFLKKMDYSFTLCNYNKKKNTVQMVYQTFMHIFILLVDNEIVFLLYEQMFQTKEKENIKFEKLF